MKIFKIGRSPAQPDKVSVTGPSEKVEECIDHLLNMEEEILQELAEREDDMPERYRPKKTTWEEKKVPKVIKDEILSLFTEIMARFVQLI